ncbi:FAD-dependent oxidoreductase, partial [Pseudomonas aeruginosa]
MNAFNGAARNNAEPMRFRSLGGWVEQPDDLQPALTGHVGNAASSFLLSLSCGHLG